MEPDDWMVGLITDDGRHTVFTGGGGVNPSQIADVVFPVSLPWENEPQLYRVGLQQVEVQQRNQGPERHYSARLEDTVPNSDQIWEMELELWEYPPGAFNSSSLHHTDQVRNAIWDPDDLRNAMRQRY